MTEKDLHSQALSCLTTTAALTTQEEYSFFGKYAPDLHIFRNIKGMELARGPFQAEVKVTILDGHRRIFGRVTQFFGEDFTNNGLPAPLTHQVRQ